ncbi:MAG: DHHA1 domain-containing protein, partial [Actinomycetota bacterium]
ESSIGANLRRIEAVTGVVALGIARDNETLLSEVETKLKTSRNELVGRVDNLLKQLRESEKLVLALKAKEGSSEAAGLIDSAEDINGVKLVVAIIPNKKPEELRSITDEIRNRLTDVAIALGSVNDEGVSLLVAFSRQLAGERMDAVAMIREAAPRIGGGGGGRPDLAQAGGKNADGLNDALAIIKEAVKKRLS